MTSLQPILTGAKSAWPFDVPKAMSWVKSTTGKGKLRQMADMVRLSVRGRFEPRDYFLFGLFDPSLTPAEKRSFLSSTGSSRLNHALNPHVPDSPLPMIWDKMLTRFLFDGIGVPMPETRAHFSTLSRFPSPTTLRTAAELARWLQGPQAALPLFGKPVHSRRGYGGVSLMASTNGGQSVRLGDGREVGVEALAAEIAASYPDGYIFQELMTNHPDLAAAIGPTVGLVRLVTLLQDDGPEVLYSLLRIPAPGAMVDSSLGGRQLMVLQDPEDGRFLRVQDMFRIAGREAAIHPTTGAALHGLVPPGFREGVALALQGHATLPGLGILGWDIALTAKGPLFTEVNSNPWHYIYQRAANRGVMNLDFAPRIDAALRRVRRVTKA